MIDSYAGRAHFHRHLAPVWAALPDEFRGQMWRPYQRATWPGEVPSSRHQVRSPVMVAASGDVKKMRGRRIVYLEHGAGQSYLPGRKGLSSSYSGGPGHDDVVLFLCPNEAVAGRWRDRYPDKEAVVVGCPALDSRITNPGPGTVVVTWHWECNLTQETRSAFAHYARGLPGLKELVEGSGRRLIGHAHPKLLGMDKVYGVAGIEWVPSLEEVYERAGLMLVDNSSVGYEFAALGRPTIWMNAPWYRRDVHHGLRFWDQVPGPEVDDVLELLDMVGSWVRGEDRGWWQTWLARGKAIGESVLGPFDGLASMRAAAAIGAYADAHG